MDSVLAIQSRLIDLLQQSPHIDFSKFQVQKFEMFEIQLITAAETWPLRHKILRPHQELKSSIFPQDEWPKTFHVGARANGQIVGVATFHEEDFSQLAAHMPFRLRGMATDGAFHGQGIGRLVLEKGIQELKTRGCDLLWCNARQIAFPFYEKLGLLYLGPLFDIPTLGPHKVMYKYLR